MSNHDQANGQEPVQLTGDQLAEILPFVQTYFGSIIVIKQGGHAMGDGEPAKQFADVCIQLKMMGLHPVIVHGGGPQISAMLARFGVTSTFVAGMRVTDAATMEVVEMVLSTVNGQIASGITQAGKQRDVRGMGLSGKGAGLITAERRTRTVPTLDQDEGNEIDLGFVGEPTQIHTRLVLDLIHAQEGHYIPVIAPIGVSDEGETLNINADTVAGAVAGALKAKRLLLATDVKGVFNRHGELIRQMTVSEARALIAEGVAVGGMIPKLETAMSAVELGVEGVVIMDGRSPNTLLQELFTNNGSGTLINR